MQFSKQSLDLRSIVEQICNSQEFEARLQQKFQSLTTKYADSPSSDTTRSLTKPPGDIIQQISSAIDNLVVINVNKVMQAELKSMTQEISRLKDQLKSHSTTIALLRSKVDCQQVPATNDQYRNRFQLIRKPANMIVSGGAYSTTYSTSPSMQPSEPSSHNWNKTDINKLQEDMQSIKKQVNRSLQLSQQLKDLKERVEVEGDRLRLEIDNASKNNDIRFSYTQQSIKKHMERSLESVWKILTSIKGQIEQISGDLTLNQSGILTDI